MKDPRIDLAQSLERLDRIVRDAAGGRETFFANERVPDGAGLAAVLPPLEQREREMAGEDDA